MSDERECVLKERPAETRVILIRDWRLKTEDWVKLLVSLSIATSPQSAFALKLYYITFILRHIDPLWSCVLPVSNSDVCVMRCSAAEAWSLVSLGTCCIDSTPRMNNKVMISKAQQHDVTAIQTFVIDRIAIGARYNAVSITTQVFDHTKMHSCSIWEDFASSVNYDTNHK